MSLTQSNAAVGLGSLIDRGARDEETVTRVTARFKSASLAFLSNAARDALEADVRAIAREEAGLPALVSQRTVERWTGLPNRDYLAEGRAGAYPTWKVKRLVFARTADVIAWVESHSVQRAASDGDDLDAALAAVGARRVVGASR